MIVVRPKVTCLGLLDLAPGLRGALLEGRRCRMGNATLTMLME